MLPWGSGATQEAKSSIVSTHQLSAYAGHYALRRNGHRLMKAADITEPGLYWLISKWPGGASLARVDGVLGCLRLERLKIHVEERLEGGGLDHLEHCDFIGPFPPPGKGPKFQGFKAALEALCQAYGVTLSVSSHGGLQVWDAGAFTRDPVHCADMSDCTSHDGLAP